MSDAVSMLYDEIEKAGLRGAFAPKKFFHQTSRSASTAIHRGGFKVNGSRGAGGGDDGTPNGVFLKPTKAPLKLRRSGRENQIPVRSMARNPLRVADRADLTAKLRRIAPDYARHQDAHTKNAAQRNAKQKNFEGRWAAASARATKPRHRKALLGVLFRNAFKGDSSGTKADLNHAKRQRVRATSALRRRGYDSVHIARDDSSDGQKVKTTILLNPKHARVRKADEPIALLYDAIAKARQLLLTA